MAGLSINTIYPSIFETADSLSLRSQRKFLFLVGFYNVALIGIPVFFLLVEALGWPAEVSLIAPLLVMICAILLMYDRNQQSWYDFRAYAESLKSAAWQFSMRARPYDCDDGEAEDKFLAVMADLDKDHKIILAEFSGHAAGPRITNGMRSARNLPVAERCQFYRAHRVDDQAEFYKNKSGVNKSAAVRWSRGVVFLTVLGVAIFVFRDVWGALEKIPSDMFAVLASTAFSWMQTKKFAELYAAYSLTSVEISGVYDALARVETEEALATVVDDSETAFSREHTQWRVRRNCI